MTPLALIRKLTATRFGFPILLTLAWLVPTTLIGISGEFPLNDDFAYARATHTLLQSGQFHRLEWTYTPILTNVAIGAAFSQLFGFSFATLRASSVFFGWLGVLGVYALCRQAGATRTQSALGAALFAFNPVYLNLSYTFMTEVPFIALLTWSQVFLLAWFARKRSGCLVAGLVLGVAALLSRQTGLALIGALAVVSLLTLRRRQWIAVALSVSGALLAYRLALPLFYDPEAGGRYATVFASLYAKLRSEHLISHLVHNALRVWIYLGAFIAPAVLLAALAHMRQATTETRRRCLLVTLFTSAIALFAFLYLALPLPPGLNIIRDLGLGPIRLDGQESLPRAAAWTWWLALLLALLSAGGALALLLGLLRKLWVARHTRPGCWLLIAFPAIFLLPHLVSTPLFDRYMIPVLPSLLALVLAEMLPRNLPRSRFSGRPGRPEGVGPSVVLARCSYAAAGSMLVIMGAFSTLGTRDYLEHHRARWALLDDAHAAGITSRQVDGGFEYLAWYNYHPDPERALGKGSWGYWLDDDEYIVSLRPCLDGYSVFASNTHRRWLPPGEETLYVHHRDFAPTEPE